MGMREKLIELIRKADKEDNESLTQDVHYAFMADFLISNGVTIPVRCKDCKHWADGVNGCTEHVKCCKIGFYMVGENGYCVYGERRTECE
jgi:hypothetical protein